MPNPRRLSKAQSDELMERLSREFAAQFARIEQDLLQTMSDDFRRGYHGRVASAERHMEIARLRQRTLVMLNDLQNNTPAMVQRMIDTASEQGALSGLSMLQGSGWIGGGAQLVQSPAVLSITTELVTVAQNATRAILPSLDQFIRRAVAETVPDVLLGMSTQKQAQAKIWQKSLQQGITHLTDASGRRWNLATYVEMASRTATRRAFTESSVYQMEQHNVQLFTPVIGRDSCSSCAYWAGKILSRGTTGVVYMQHATDDTREIRVDIAATIDEARAQGWQHPNCRCQLVAYIPGLSVVADSPGHDPVREGQRVKLRELERKVRAAKVEELAAVTPEQKAAAKAKVRDAQAAIRDHVEEADIPRRRDREQIDLGHKNRPPRTRPRPVPGPPRDPMPQLKTTMNPIDVRDAKLDKLNLTPPPRTRTTPKPKVKVPPPVVAPKAKPPVVAPPRAKAAPVRKPAKEKLAFEADLNDVPVLERPMTWNEDTRWNQPVVNPNHRRELKPGNKDYAVNCTRVATAMEMRARGYNVTAGAAGKDKSHMKSNAFTANNWRTTAGRTPKFSKVDLTNLDQNTSFKTAKEGARFFVMGAWQMGGAHIWNARKVGGKLVFFEGQSPRAWPAGYSKQVKPGTTNLLRVDTLVPTDDIKGWLEWDGK